MNIPDTVPEEHDNNLTDLTNEDEIDPLVQDTRKIKNPDKSHRKLGQNEDGDKQNSKNKRNMPNDERFRFDNSFEGNSNNYSSIQNNNTTQNNNNNNNNLINRDLENGINNNVDYVFFLNNWKTIIKIMLFLNILVLICLFVSSFYTEFILPIGRNETFNSLIYVFISLVGNCFNLWFGDIGLYSLENFQIDIILTIYPIINLLILSWTHYTRQRINLLSIFVSFWLSLSFGLSAFQSYKLRQFISDANLKNLKDKHTLNEWLKIGFRNITKIICCIIVFLMILSSFLFMLDTHNVSREANFVHTDSRNFNTININCYGLENTESKQPIIIFEHGGEDTSYTSGRWVEELYHLGQIDKYCVYDRFGYGLSDSISAPWSLKSSSDALRFALVERLELKGPFLMVGFDYGGLVARVFAAENRELCSGLMLVESWHEELLLKQYFKKLFPGDDDDDDGDNYNVNHNKHLGGKNLESFNMHDILGTGDKTDWRVPEREIKKRNGLKVWWDGLWSSIGLNLHYSWLAKHRNSYERIFGKDMEHQGKFLRTKFLEIISSSLLSYKDILETNSKLKNIKLSVVSSKEMIKRSSIWGDWQRKLTKLSQNTKEWKIVDGEHEFFKNGVGKELTQEVLLRLIHN